MTRFLLSFLLCLVAFALQAQENSFLTIGIGYPIFIGTNDTDYDYSINKGNSNLFLEKEIKLLNKFPQLRLTPGLSYFLIKETYNSSNSGALGGGGEGYYKHRALSTYLKLIYEINRQPYVVTDYYIGLHAGWYINTKTTGVEDWWALGEDGYYGGSRTIDKSGEDLFHSNYFGIIAGIRPLGDGENFIQPNIEFGFYPSFATVNSYYVNAEEKKSMFQISVSVGFGNKSRTTNTE